MESSDDTKLGQSCSSDVNNDNNMPTTSAESPFNISQDSKTYYPETKLPIQDELHSVLDSILHMLNGSLKQEGEMLIMVTQTVIHLLKGLKEELDTRRELTRVERFSMKRFEGSDEDIKFWTGFYSYETLIVFYEHVCQNHASSLKYWMARNSQEEQANKRGPKCSFDPIDQMFMTLVKLKQGSGNKDIAERFKISDSYVTRIFITWINFLFNALVEGTNIWMSKGKVRKYMPAFFKGLYPDLQVIIDCTGISVERPSDLEVQAATYSQYKHGNTLKGLIGISPSGVTTFVSDLYEGSISDNELTMNCGLLDLCEPNVAIMADRGFTCKEAIMKRKLRHVTPHFLMGAAQMQPHQLVESVAVARCLFS
ncbi:uncharacterized protein LOC119733853 [Patiria miniata]|uniref:DDE Tnp4 domain-containing protein n=1 Tax=Patiria miniata TaxID=46514 RepID=A0A914AHJ0_PATMI|nr:uncharacterized protein LOC119733853 [Patiria miniata]